MKFKFIILLIFSIHLQVAFGQTNPLTELYTNKPSYVAGERAVLLVSVKKSLNTNPNDEVYIEGTLGSQRIKMTAISGYHAAYVTSELPVGNYDWETKVYTLNTTGANYYRSEIQKCDDEEIRLKRLYNDETDASKRANLTSAINENVSNRATLQSQFLALRVLKDTKQHTIVVSAIKSKSRMLDPMVLAANHSVPVYYLGQASTLKATVIPANISSSEALEFQLHGSFDGQSVLMTELSSTEFSYVAQPTLMTLGQHTFEARLYARSQHNSTFLRIAIDYTVNRKLELELLRDSSANAGLSGYYQREIDELDLILNAISDVYSNSLTFISNTSKVFDVQPLPAMGFVFGSTHACATNAYSLACWGAGNLGALGLGDDLTRNVANVVPGLHEATTLVSASIDHTCAIKNGSAYCWGTNTNGKLGNNSTLKSNIPVLISAPAVFQKISAGFNHTCGISSTSLYCWGSNGQGQFGNGTTIGSMIPVLIPLGEGVTDVQASEQYTCVITVSQKVQCFGSNFYNQLGDGTNVANRTSPVTIISSGVNAIALGGYTSCAIVSGGMKCWGEGTQGKLGNSTSVGSSVPVNVTGLSSGVTSISVGFNHVCGVVNGSAKCWGTNIYGLLGDGVANTNVTNVPTQVIGMTTLVDKIFAGVQSTCLSKNQKLYCWGRNNTGQLGIGSYVSTPTITEVPVPL